MEDVVTTFGKVLPESWELTPVSVCGSYEMSFIDLYVNIHELDHLVSEFMYDYDRLRSNTGSFNSMAQMYERCMVMWPDCPEKLSLMSLYQYIEQNLVEVKLRIEIALI